MMLGSAAVVLAACAGSASSSAGSSGARTSTSVEYIDSLNVGDCFDQLSSTPAPASGSSGPSSDTTIQIGNVTKTDCATAHYGELIATRNNPAPSGAPFPGAAALGNETRTFCAPQFQTYVGTDYNTSSYAMAAVYPTSSTWPNGDRKEECIVHDQNGQMLTGSVKATHK